MDQRTRNYLIRAHNKVITHYQQVLQANSLPQPERERVRRRLAEIEAELETLGPSRAPDPMPLTQRGGHRRIVPWSANEEVVP
jgi:hypothetical protein